MKGRDYGKHLEAAVTARLVRAYVKCTTCICKFPSCHLQNLWNSKWITLLCFADEQVMNQTRCCIWTLPPLITGVHQGQHTTAQLCVLMVKESPFLYAWLMCSCMEFLTCYYGRIHHQEVNDNKVEPSWSTFWSHEIAQELIKASASMDTPRDTSISYIVYTTKCHWTR